MEAEEQPSSLCHCVQAIPLPSFVIYLMYWGAFGVTLAGQSELGSKITIKNDAEGVLMASHVISQVTMLLSLIFCALTSGQCGGEKHRCCFLRLFLLLVIIYLLVIIIGNNIGLLLCHAPTPDAPIGI